MPEETPMERPTKPVDAVLLIDADNDPHMPPEFTTTEHTLVRLFMRPGAKVPRGLEKRVGDLPMCVAVVIPKGGANAADFAMSLHAGLLHATLPMQIPFTLVTFDTNLSFMAQELQRLGRQTTLWTSHPEGGGRRRRPASEAKTPRAPRQRRPARASSARAASSSGASGGPAKTLAEATATYAGRLTRMKDVPSRLKTLLNDIKNRAPKGSYTPEEILEELKRTHGYSIDAQGRVHRPEASAAR